MSLDFSSGMRFHPQYNVWLSPTVLYAPPVAYLVLALWCHRAMKTRQTPSWVPSVVKLYNVSQVVLCLYMTIGLLPVVGIPNVFGIGLPETAQIEWFVFVHYLSKYLDWLDTVWMILKKKSDKQMSFLHLYHHATIGVVWGVVLSSGFGSGTVGYGAFINSVTHVLMYTHYFVTSVGLRNPLKNYLTMWQIGQFYSCFLHANLLLWVFSDSIKIEVWRLAWIQFFYHITMVYLFTFKLHWVPDFIKGPSSKKSA